MKFKTVRLVEMLKALIYGSPMFVGDFIIEIVGRHEKKNTLHFN